MRIADRIVNHYHDDIFQKHISKDGMIARYEKDLKKATDEKKFLTVAIVKQQIKTRIQQLSNEYVARKMESLVNSGELGAFLDDDDHDKFEELRLKLYLIYDGIDYILADMASFFHTLGFDKAELGILRDVERARKSIQSWGEENTHIKGSFAEDIIDIEGERVYKFICRRYPFVNKYMERAYELYKAENPDKPIV